MSSRSSSSSSSSSLTLIATATMATSVTALLYCLGTKKSCKANALSTVANTSTGKKTYLFVGDIGGTNTRLAIYPAEASTNASSADASADASGGKAKDKEPIYTKEFLNEKYITGPNSTRTFEQDIFLPFLSECNMLDWDGNGDDNNNNKNDDNDGLQLVACFAVAGPVKNNTAAMTNLGGEDKDKDKGGASENTEILINGNDIEQSTIGRLKYITKCKLVNDFVGQGYGLLDLDLNKEVIELVPGSIDAVMKAEAKDDDDDHHHPLGPKACVGAGTGLGECFLTTSSLHPDDGYECYPTEGGHVDFVPRDALQVKLLNYLKQKFDQPNRISVERVVSGIGLANIYEFLAKEFPKLVNKDIHSEFENAGALQGKVVGVNANGDSPDELCKKAMDIMMSAYGAETGNCALKYIPTGGLYVSGGLTPKNIQFIKGEDSPFMKAYKDKGRMSGLLDSVPLFAVMVEDLGLRGAKVCALREYNSMKNTFSV